MKIDFEGAPKKSKEQLFADYAEDLVLVLDDVLASTAAWTIIFQDILDILKYDFSNEKVRHQIQRFKFHKDDKTYYGETRPNFLSNMILWKAFMDIDSQNILDESYIFNFKGYRMEQLVEYINFKILPIHPGDFHARNKTVDDIWYPIIAISYAFTPIMGMGVSNYDIIQMEKRNPEIVPLMEEPINPELQPNEIEDILNDRIKKVVDIIINDKGYNNFKPLYASGNNLSMGQSKEIWVRIGTKADIEGHTIPVPVDANFLEDGLRKPSYVYINAISGRKAAILSKNEMSDPGIFSKLINWIATPSSCLRKDYEICDSARPVFYTIKDEQFLKCMNGRYYYEDGVMKKVRYRQDKHLIGMRLPFRDPCTCNSKEGICHACYGDLYDINKDLFSVGSMAATKTGEPLGQSTLSLKHTQQAKSTEVQLPEDMFKVLELSSGEITLTGDSELSEDVYIVFTGKGVTVEEGDDKDYYYCNSFDLINSSQELISHVEDANGSLLYLSDAMIALYRKAKDKTAPILISEFDDEETLFTIEVSNKEVSSMLKSLQNILSTSSHGGANTVDELCQIFCETLLDCNIKYDFTHASCILRALLRKKSNVEEFPDWGRNDDLDDYRIVTIRQGLMYHPSPLVRICSGYLKRQLTTLDLFKQSGTSHLDPLFVDILSYYL